MKKIKFRGCLLFSLLTCLAFQELAAQQIIAYYSGSSKKLGRYPVNLCSEIIFSFCQLNGNSLAVDNHKDSLTIRALVALKKKNHKLKILLSLGGWGGCSTCSDVFSSDSGRSEFASSVLSLTNYFHTDGIDLDWEFPSLPAYPEYPFKVEDKINFTLMVQTLRERMGNSKEISVICAGSSPFLEGSLDLPSLVSYVDRINLMTYDLIGSKTKFTGHHTALYSSSAQSASVEHAVHYLDSLNIPHGKIAIGSAFYARTYRVLENNDHGLHQPGQFEKFIPMKQIRKEYTDRQGYSTYWDAESQAAYKYNDREKIFLTYDDERSVAAKVKYIKDKKLNGIFIWELRLDRSRDGLLEVIYNRMRK